MAQSDLPTFVYHPNPIATGAVEASENDCVCCNQARGFIYQGPVYAIKDLSEAICPWCIADGTAAAKFNATFLQDAEVSLPPALNAALFQKTPGYASWQGENWLCHCADACEFHGDLSAADLKALTPEQEAQFLAENDWIEDWPDVKKHYEPAGDLALYKFICRHCGIVRLGAELS